MTVRWVLKARYAWNNSANSALVGARNAWDTGAWRRRWNGYVSYPRGQGPTLAYAGAKGGYVNVLQLMEELRDRMAAPTTYRRQFSIARRDILRGHHVPTADIIAIGCSPRQAAKFPTTASLILPYRVHLIVDIDADAETIRHRISKRERWQFARNRRANDWALECTKDPTSFAYFYEQLHLPTMQRRHGERTRSEGYDSAYECIFRHGMLFFVTEGGQRLAGALCRWNSRNGILTTRLLGVLGGSEEHYRSGAFKALYHFIIEWACSNGVRHVDFQGTEPFISRGIFQWKRKFRPRITLPPNHFSRRRLWIRIVRDTPRTRDYLNANPVLAMAAGGGLEPVYFFDSKRPPRSDLYCGCPGVSGERLIDLDDFLSALSLEPAYSPLSPGPCQPFSLTVLNGAVRR